MELKKYYKDAKDELGKVIFPTKSQIRMAFVSVSVVVAVITLFISLIDAIFHFGISSIL